jgi:multiple sugar transport system ATP-binding protein
MAFALKLRKLPKQEIDKRVREAARILGLDDFLGRKPRALSGGQRQRVAMGRAIVREPQAFLMDEPLSNLDAKLRVQMRSEIARIQHDLGVTTIYVTHDQTEAMTMGDRVAVMRKGKLLQVDSPQTLYDRPVSLFVAGFIGSPAMNMVEAQLEATNGATVVHLGGIRLGVDDQLFSARPALKEFVGRKVILGVRPEDMEDASLVPDAPQDRRISVSIDLREALGAEVLVHFTLDAPMAMTEDVKELVADTGAETPDVLEGKTPEDKSVFVARLNPRTQAKVGDRLDLLVDTGALHFFDPETGEGIFDQKKG